MLSPAFYDRFVGMRIRRVTEGGRDFTSWDVSPAWTASSWECADVGENNDRRPIVRGGRVGREGASESRGGRKVNCVAALPGNGDGEGGISRQVWMRLGGMFEDGARQCQTYLRHRGGVDEGGRGWTLAEGGGHGGVIKVVG
jgi:hypothetical protein